MNVSILYRLGMPRIFLNNRRRLSRPASGSILESIYVYMHEDIRNMILV